MSDLGAKLVWDGGPEVAIPEEMGTPAENQLQGTVAEQLTELAGRVCYDSLGKGRDSEAYHKHILQIGHLSVVEHFNFTISVISEDSGKAALGLLNRPGLWVDVYNEEIYLTANLRTVLEWDQWNDSRTSPEAQWIGASLRRAAHLLAPMIVSAPPEGSRGKKYAIREPKYPEQRWVSMFMKGSRGFSHEQVRHGDRTAISQRSTRYVNESESAWVHHPLMQKYWDEPDMVGNASKALTTLLIRDAQRTYSAIVKDLKSWLIERGVDKLNARKQARGAARGYLGNALQTEMIFSASVAQWKRMIRLRCSPYADAEIRIIFADVVRELKASRHASSFQNFKLVDSPDGIGQVAEEEVS